MQASDDDAGDAMAVARNALEVRLYIILKLGAAPHT